MYQTKVTIAGTATLVPFTFNDGTGAGPVSGEPYSGEAAAGDLETITAAYFAQRSSAGTAAPREVKGRARLGLFGALAAGIRTYHKVKACGDSPTEGFATGDSTVRGIPAPYLRRVLAAVGSLKVSGASGGRVPLSVSDDGIVKIAYVFTPEDIGRLLARLDVYVGSLSRALTLKRADSGRVLRTNACYGALVVPSMRDETYHTAFLGLCHGLIGAAPSEATRRLWSAARGLRTGARFVATASESEAMLARDIARSGLATEGHTWPRDALTAGMHRPEEDEEEQIDTGAAEAAG